MTARPQPTAYERHAPAPEVVRDALAASRHAVFWIEDAGQERFGEALTAATTADLAIVGGGYLGLWSAIMA